MAKSRLRAKIPELEEAFSGRFGSHHAAVCRQVIWAVSRGQRNTR